MGEMAEMFLEGWYCQGCGALMCDPEEGPQGYPGFCSPSCAGKTDDQAPTGEDELQDRTCPICGKVCKSEDGALMHLDAKHPGWEAEEAA